MTETRRTMNTAIKTAATVVGMIAATPAYADFYDGADLPPNKDWQIQTNLRIGEEVGITVVPKYIRDDGLVTALAVGETAGKLDAPGFGVGYRMDIPLESGAYIGIQPMMQGTIDGDTAMLVPTMYITGAVGKWTFDPRIQVPTTISYETRTATLDGVVGGLTIGYQVADRLRVGPDVEMNALQTASATYGFLLRFDLPGEKGQHWMELQLRTDQEKTAQSTLQYRINF